MPGAGGGWGGKKNQNGLPLRDYAQKFELPPSLDFQPCAPVSSSNCVWTFNLIDYYKFINNNFLLTISFQKLAPKSRAPPTSFWRPARLCNCLAECFWARKVRTMTTRRTRSSTGSTITGYSTRNSNPGSERGRGLRPASSSINSRCRVGFRYKLVSMFEWPWLITFVS